MNSRERVTAALRHEEPDRTPIFEYVLQSPVADVVLGRPYSVGSPHTAKMMAERGWAETVGQQAIDLLDLACVLGHDLLYVCPNPTPPQPSAATEPVSVPDDPVAAMRMRIAQAEGASPEPRPERFLIYECLDEEMRVRGLDLPILAPAYSHGVWTDVALMQTMLLESDLARRHFACCTQQSLAMVAEYAARGVEMIGVGGDFAGNRGPLISPAAYREFIVPEVRKVSRRIHEHGAFAINASDGNLWSVIEDYLLGCEADGCIEVELRAGMDLALLKQRFGQRITFLGNLDCSHVLSFGTPEDVEAHVRECLEKGWGRGGHILCSNNAITSSVPVENFLAITSAYRRYFDLPESWPAGSS